MSTQDAEILEKYREQAEVLEVWLHNEGECPLCGWTARPKHADGCAFAPVEPAEIIRL